MCGPRYTKEDRESADRQAASLDGHGNELVTLARNARIAGHKQGQQRAIGAEWIHGDSELILMVGHNHACEFFPVLGLRFTPDSKRDASPMQDNRLIRIEGASLCEGE